MFMRPESGSLADQTRQDRFDRAKARHETSRTLRALSLATGGILDDLGPEHVMSDAEIARVYRAFADHIG